MASTAVIPVIDLAPCWSRDAAARRRLAAAVDEACQTVGFLLVTGHGVPASMIARVFEAAGAFFDRPLAEKLLARPSDSRMPRGYSAFASKNLARTYGLAAPPDLREQFFVGPLEDWSEAFAHIPAARGCYASNVWPERPAGFREVMSEYYRVMEALARDLMRLFALALGMPEGWFDDKLDRHFSTLPTNHYPAPAGEPLPGQLRTGVHTDFGSLTILAVDDAPGGLQAQPPGTETWIDVQPARDQLVVNLGDMMARWTNDRWRSTLHRVVNPPPELATASRRQTVGFFLHPNYDARVACLPTCAGPDNPPRYPPILAGEHMREKLERRLEADTT